MGALTVVVIKRLFANYWSCHQLTILSQQFEVNSVLAIIINALYFQNVAKGNFGNASCGFVSDWGQRITTELHDCMMQGGRKGLVPPLCWCVGESLQIQADHRGSNSQCSK